MSQKTIQPGIQRIHALAFEKYQSARREFVNTIAESARKPENIDSLMQLQVLQLLRPLLLDTVSAIQQTAALAIGRLANSRDNYAEQIVSTGILPEVVNGLHSQDKHYIRNSSFVIRTIGRHSPELAQECVKAGALEPLVQTFTEAPYNTPDVRESAANALGTIASHNSDLAQSVIEAGTIPALISAVNSPETSLCRVGVIALGEIAKHSQSFSQAIIDSNGIKCIAPYLTSSDPKLKQQVLITLSQIAKHSVDTAELVADSPTFPSSISCLYDQDSGVRRAAASLICEVVKHTQELAQLVINNSGANALVQYLKNNNDPINAVNAISSIAHFSSSLSTSLIESGAPYAVACVFVSSKYASVKAAAAKALGEMGQHSPTHASALTQMNALSLLLEAHNDPSGSDELRKNTRHSLKIVIQKTSEIEALQCLIRRAPENILAYVLEQISKLLPKNPKARAPFVSSGGFKDVQNIKAEPGTKIATYIEAINACYPDHAVRYYSPSYPQEIVDGLDKEAS